MDQLSSLYVRMASGTQSQLHNSPAVMSFVDQMQARIEKSSAPRKNFLIDPSTPHGDVVIAESSALKPGLGWITLQVTEGIRRGTHEWGIKIEHQGESTDGSGLMLGIVPKSFSKYDSFISQGGGWCLSRAGKFYGHWRRPDPSGGALTFGTGDRVIFTLDYEASIMTVRVGEKTVIGELSNLTVEVFPAISLHYRHQHVRFEYHTVHDTSAHHLPWTQRQAFPMAVAYLNLSPQEVEQLPLSSYLFSSLFSQKQPSGEAEVGTRGPKAKGSLNDTFNSSGDAELEQTGRDQIDSPDSNLYCSGSRMALPSTGLTDESSLAVRRRARELRSMRMYASKEAATARLTVLSRAFAAVRRYVELSPVKSRFLSPHVTAEYLRQRVSESAKDAAAGSSTPTYASAGSWANYDATLNCGAVIVTHLFLKVASSENPAAVPLLSSLRSYLLSLPLYSLAESTTAAACGGNPQSALSHDTVQLAVDSAIQLIDPVVGSGDAGSSGTALKDVSLSPLHAALVEVVVLFALQRGLVSEVLRTCRYLLRAPATSVSSQLGDWLLRYTPVLRPQRELPDIGRALRNLCENPAAITPTRIDPSATLLATAYGLNQSIYIHTAEGLSKWGRTAAAPYMLLCETKQPLNICISASRSSLATTQSQVLLLTDRMVAEGVAVVMYNLSLDVHQVCRWADVHASWPRSEHANAQLVTATEDRVLLVYERHAGQPAAVLNGAAAAAGTPSIAAAARRTAMTPTSSAAQNAETVELEVQCYAASSLHQQRWCRTLQPPNPTGLSLTHCLSLRKPSVVDLGPPEDHLHVPGGHVTVELWAQFLDKEDAATLYLHGDKSTSGEVFIELTRLEGAYCIRGGYRHDVRGSCVVSAPLPPTAETRLMHIALVFNGRWHLFFEGEEVAGNRQGPHVSLDSPKQRWAVGNNCTCLLAGLRVWRVGRTSREVSRDYRRSLGGDEPGLLVQLFFNEKSGNVVFNYVNGARARHAVCTGSFVHTRCDNHPWRAFASTVTSTPEVTPAMAPLHNWRDLAMTTCTSMASALILSTPVGDNSPFTPKEGGYLLMFFDITSGAAQRALFFLTSRSTARHCMRSDPAGRLWEMFEMDANSASSSGAGEQDAAYLMSLLTDGPPSSQQQQQQQRAREKVLAVAPLPLTEDTSDSLSAFTVIPATDSDSEAALYCSPISSSISTTTATASTIIAGPSPSANISSAAQDDTSSLLCLSSTGPKSQSPQVTYGTLGVWLLQLLSLHAEGEPTQEQALFSPLADDVGSRCVAEVRRILDDHFRVVKSTNARRAIALKSQVSRVVVASALQVLLRLVRRVRAFGLHPSSLNLTVLDGACSGDNEMAAITLLTRELNACSLRRRSSAGAITDGGVSTAPGSPIHTEGTLLGLLGDVINEDGITISPTVASLARTIVVEGVELFLPDVRHRAKLLRDLLRAPPGDDRVPAMETLLDAIAQSFSTVLSAAPLLYSENSDTAAAAAEAHEKDRLPTPDAASLMDLCGTLHTLLEESLVQWKHTLRTARMREEFSSSSMSSDGCFLGSLSEAISSLQLLLLSACQGLRVEVAVSELYSSQPTATLDLQRLSFSQAVLYHPCVRNYYKVLLDCTMQCFSTCLDALPAAAPPTTTLSRGQLEATLSSLPSTFVSAPLHTALGALPLVMAIEDAEWFLHTLEELHTTCLILTERLKESLGAASAVTQVAQSVGEALFYVSSWVAAFMFNSTAATSSAVSEDVVRRQLGVVSVTTTPTFHQQKITGSAALSPQQSLNEKAVGSRVTIYGEVEQLCNNKLLAGGLISEAAMATSPRRQLVQYLLKNPTKWVTTAQASQLYGAKSSTTLSKVVVTMAATVLFLSPLPLRVTDAKSTAAVEVLMGDTVQRLTRTVQRELLSRDYAAKSPLSTNVRATRQELMEAAFKELLQRCELLLHLKPIMELFSLDDMLWGSEVGSGRATTSMTPRQRWKWAYDEVRCRLVHFRVHLLSHPQLTFNAALSLVSEVVLSSVATADNIRAAIEARQELTSLRLQGLHHLLKLLRRESQCAESMAQLMSAYSNGRQVHHEEGLNICDNESIRQLRGTLYNIIEWVVGHGTDLQQRQQQHSDEKQFRGAASQIPLNVQLSSATVLCGTLDRQWWPRDFAFFHQLQVVPRMLVHCLSPFECGLDGSVADTPAMTKPGGPSVMERQHRNEVMVARVSRRSSKSLAIVAAINQSNASAEGGGSTSGLSDGTGELRYTTSEVMRLRVWTSIKKLMLQATALLQRQAPLSLVERQAVMLFLARCVEAMGEELRRCWQLLQRSRNYAATPSAFSDDEEEVFCTVVVDQVDVLCSLLAAIGSTLGPANGYSADDQELALLNDNLSKACGGVAQVLLELVLMDLSSDSHASGRDTGSNKPHSRYDAAACARTAALILRRCLPNTLQRLCKQSPFLNSIYATTSLSAILQPSPDDNCHTFLRGMVDLAMFAMGTTGQSHVTTHVILACREVLLQSAWAAELQHFVAPYQRYLRQYATAVVSNATADSHRTRLVTSACISTWLALLGGEILVPPSLGSRACYIEEGNGTGLQEVYIVDLSSPSTCADPSSNGPSGGRGDTGSGSGSKTGTVTVVPVGEVFPLLDSLSSGASPSPHLTQEQSLSPDQLFLSAWDDPILLPPCPSIVSSYLIPAIQLCIPLLSEQSEGGTATAPLEGTELILFVRLLHLTAGAVRSSAQACYELTTSGAMRTISSYATQSIVRFPLSIHSLREFGAYIAVRTAERAAEVLRTGNDGLPRASPPPPQALGSTDSPRGPNNNNSDGPSQPHGATASRGNRSPVSLPHGNIGGGEAILDSLRNLSPPSSSRYLSIFASLSGATQTSGRGGVGDYSLSRLARSFGLLNSNYGTLLSRGAMSGGHKIMPPHTEMATGGTMVLAFPMWSSGGKAATSLGSLVVTANPAPAASSVAVSFPCWSDGMSIELAVMLCSSDMCTPLGDQLTIPGSWELSSAKTRREFRLLSLYGAPSSSKPILQVTIRPDELLLSLDPPQESGAKGAELRVPLKSDDWNKCIHLAVVLDSRSVLLTKGGEAATTTLSNTTAAALEHFLRQSGAIQKVVVGRTPSNTPSAEDAGGWDMGAMALVSGLRLWGSAVLKTSLRAVADLVGRDNALPPFDLSEQPCFLELKEGTGGCVYSSDTTQRYRGTLSGSVRWSIIPLPPGFYPSIEMSGSRLHDGVTTTPPSLCRTPRQQMLDFVNSLSAAYEEQFSCDVMQSLVSHASRMATVAALEMGMSPAYALLPCRPASVCKSNGAPRTGVMAQFDPLAVLDPTQSMCTQLLRLFQFHDGGYLSSAHVHLIHQLVDQLDVLPSLSLKRDGSSNTVDNDSTSALESLVLSTALQLRQLRRDEGEVFVMELPPAPPEPRDGASAAAVPVVTSALPISLVNGGSGLLTFDPKYRNMEQATVYKDAEQKSVLAKYPDGQGGWPACQVTAETPWVYLRCVPSTAGHRLAVEGRPHNAAPSSLLTVTIKSLKQVVLHAVVHAMCKALLRVPRPPVPGLASPHKASTPHVAAGLLDARVVGALITQSSTRASDDECVHVVQLLSLILDLWSRLPSVQPHDQMPLSLALAHINYPLVNIIQHTSSEAELTSLVSPATGTYSPYVQNLIGLVINAIRAQCAWNKTTYAEQVQRRWTTLRELWTQSSKLQPRFPERATDDAGGKSGNQSIHTITSLSGTDSVQGTAKGGEAKKAAALTVAIPPAQAPPPVGVVQPTLILLEDVASVESPLMPGTVSQRHGGGNGGGRSGGKAGRQAWRKGNGMWVISGAPSGSSNSSNGNTAGAASNGASSCVTVRSTVGFTTGCFYWEIYIVSLQMQNANVTGSSGSSGLVVGVVTERTSLPSGQDVLGNDGESWGFDGGRLSRLHQGYRHDFSSRVKWKTGDVIGVILDLNKNQLMCLQNSRQVATFDNLLSPQQRQEKAAVFPAVTVCGTSTCEINFGATGFVANVPPSALPVDPTLPLGGEACRLWKLIISRELSEAMEVHLLDEKNTSVTAGVAGLQHPVLSLVCQRVDQYTQGRCGPLDVGLLCPSGQVKLLTMREAKTEDAPCLLMGSVSVTKGRWYYEVLVPEDPKFSVGWSSLRSLEDQGSATGGLLSGGAASNAVVQLGSDAYSWALEGSRMIARHNRHQVSLARRTWKSGDVVGCLLDCDAGTIRFTINGHIQREVTASENSDGAVFRGIVVDGAGMVPVIALEAKASIVSLWNREDLLYPPTDETPYRPIGGVGAINAAFSEFMGQVNGTSGSPDLQPVSVNVRALEKLLRYASQAQELHPSSLRSYTLPSLYQASLTPTGREVEMGSPARRSGGAASEVCNTAGIPFAALAHHLSALQVLAHLTTLLFPFAHAGALPGTVEDTPLGVSWSFGPLTTAFRQLRTVSPPWIGLRTLLWCLDVTNGPGDPVRLSLNRRKALVVLRDPSASLTRRLRDSLFGQVYQLLGRKSAILFMTRKKLWSVTFFGEGADDVGGPYRECLAQLCSELMSSQLQLFLPSPNQSGDVGDVRDGVVLYPRCKPPVELPMYGFLGRLMGGCLRGGEPLSLYLPSSFWKLLVGDEADERDLQRVDVASVNALHYIQQVSQGVVEDGSTTAEVNDDLAELCPDGFCLQDDTGCPQELVLDGRGVPVTTETAGLFVRLAMEYKLTKMTAPQRRALQEGFHEVVPMCFVSTLKWYELEELVCGQCDYDPDALLDAARYEGITADDERVQYLRAVLNLFTRHQRALFMRFVSGRERLPPGIHLKIMPDANGKPAQARDVDDAPPPLANHNDTSPDSPPEGSGSPPSNGAVVAPQPPPTRDVNRGSQFVRHTALLQSRTNSNVSGLIPPVSPPVLHSTPPPSGQVSLNATRRPVPVPPALQESNFIVGTSSTNDEGAFETAVYDDTRLPHASTCFYWLCLPRYSSIKVMQDKLLFAIEQCVDIDADFRVRDTDVALQEEGPAMVRVSSDDEVMFEDFSHLR